MRFHVDHPERMYNVPDFLVYHFVEITTSKFGWDARGKAHEQYEAKWGMKTRHFENDILGLGRLLDDTVT